MQLLFAVLLLVALVCAWGSTCDEFGTSQEKCLAATEGGEKCAYCTSGAVGSECMKETDAKGLPSSVFKCTYASSIAAASSCEKNKDQTNCMSSSCAWCSSAAVGDECISQSDAKDLPSSVFRCSYPTSLRKN